MFDLDDLGQVHGVQHSQWFHLIVNVNLYKIITTALQIIALFFLNLCHLENICQSDEVQQSQWRHTNTDTSSIQVIPEHFS